MRIFDRNYVFPGIIALSILISAFVIAGAYKYKFKDKKRVIVTGMAEKNFVSDLIVWQGDYSRANMELKQAYTNLKNDEIAIRAYLQEKGLNSNEFVWSSVTTNRLTQM